MSLYIGIRIDTVNSVHTRLSIFTSGKRNGIETTSHGLSGQLCIDTEVAEEFVDACNADAIYWREAGDPPEWLRNHPMYVKE